jgi:hypothetical protein
LVAALAVAAHVGGLHGQFVDWDDTNHITRNPLIRSVDPAHLWAMFTEPAAKLYIPLTWLSLAVDYQFWGTNPLGYHLTNLLLHALNSWLVLGLVGQILQQYRQCHSELARNLKLTVRRDSRDSSQARNDRYCSVLPIATLTAAIFAVHPLRVESVAWATERKDVLFVCFYLLGLLAYVRWTDTGRRGWYLGCFGLFCASALSKSAAVTFPAVLLLLDALVFHHKRFVEKLPFVVVAGIISLATVVAQASGTGETVAGADVIPVWARVGLVGFCSLFYLGKFVWPVHLSAVYPTFDEMGWGLFQAAGYLAAFAGITVAAFLVRRKWPVAWAGWLFYLVTLSPTIGLMPVGIHVVADRYCYLALLGPALVVSVGLLHWRNAWPVAGAWVVALTVLSAQRTAVWANTETLFQNAVAEDARCLPAHLNLTIWYTRHQQFDQAIQHGEAAVAVAPDGLRGRKCLAKAYIGAGRYRAAAEVLRAATDRRVEDAEVWLMLGDCFTAMGDVRNAEAARRHLKSTGAK